MDRVKTKKTRFVRVRRRDVNVISFVLAKKESRVRWRRDDGSIGRVAGHTATRVLFSAYTSTYPVFRCYYLLLSFHIAGHFGF